MTIPFILFWSLLYFRMFGHLSGHYRYALYSEFFIKTLFYSNTLRCKIGGGGVVGVNSRRWSTQTDSASRKQCTNVGEGRQIFTKIKCLYLFLQGQEVEKSSKSQTWKCSDTFLEVCKYFCLDTCIHVPVLMLQEQTIRNYQKKKSMDISKDKHFVCPEAFESFYMVWPPHPCPPWKLF